MEEEQFVTYKITPSGEISKLRDCGMGSYYDDYLKTNHAARLQRLQAIREDVNSLQDPVDDYLEEDDYYDHEHWDSGDSSLDEGSSGDNSSNEEIRFEGEEGEEGENPKEESELKLSSDEDWPKL